MKYFSDVIKIIEGGVKGDIKRISDYSILLSEKLKREGEDRKSERINQILDRQGLLEKPDFESARTLQGHSQSISKQLPFDQESKLELADMYSPNQLHEKNLLLSIESRKQINEFITSYEKVDELASYGLEMPFTMILFGPPGCGKTESAFYLARKLNLPIIVARLDALISSFLGSTSKNIRRLFDYARKYPCILFLDEFDAVAKIRDDIHEMGELKRVVNSLLQNIDSLDGRSILVAATNHDKLLDQAIWRRFNTRIHISLPTEKMIEECIVDIVSGVGYTFDAKELSFFGKLLKGQSIADIQQIIRRSVRKPILEKREFELFDVVDSYFDYIQNSMVDSNDIDSVKKFRVKYIKRLDKSLSNRFIGMAVKCHHSVVGKYLLNFEEESEDV